MPSYISYKSLRDRVTTSHARTPLLRRLPLPALAIISLLVVVNLVVWAAAGIVLVRSHLRLYTANMSPVTD